MLSLNLSRADCGQTVLAPISGTVTCRIGGLCRVVVAVTVVCPVETCLIIVVGVTAPVNSEAAGACRANDEHDTGAPYLLAKTVFVEH